MRVSLATWDCLGGANSALLHEWQIRLWLPSRECNDEWKPLHSLPKATEMLAGLTPASATN